PARGRSAARTRPPPSGPCATMSPAALYGRRRSPRTVRCGCVGNGRRTAMAPAGKGEGAADERRPLRREDLRGTWAMEREAELSGARAKERAEQAKLYGLEAAASIRDRSLTLFSRGCWPPLPGRTA